MPVRILVPIVSAAALAGHAAAAGAPPPPTILVVDDEPDVVYMIGVILRQAGYHVVTAANGAEALQKLDEHAVDLILTDLAMPVMNGTELVAEIERRPTHPPVVIITAYGRRDDVPAKGFMMKPFTRNELMAEIQRALSVED